MKKWKEGRKERRNGEREGRKLGRMEGGSEERKRERERKKIQRKDGRKGESERGRGQFHPKALNCSRKPSISHVPQRCAGVAGRLP